ncbi:uncharacterized protein LOC126826986 [Patella vulgata]|uniref:uncharacterized protein LOC126826986 n=1 Tax=Patella vulgata TaxID=6465 RepID=UPI0024A91D25|nr:uncharacterized protein LOC126826986 [Patella vulgata]
MQVKTGVKCIQLLVVFIFLYSTVSLHFSLTSLLSGTTLLGFFFLRVFERIDRNSINNHTEVTNPFKGKPRIKQLPVDNADEIDRQISEYVTYDATDNITLKNFNVIKENTPCIFAKRSKIWGSKDWEEHLGLEENIFRSMPTFYKFILSCEILGLDGFVFELPGEEYCDDIQIFAKNVKRVLKVISNNDPGHGKSLQKSYIGKRGWVFEYNKMTMFITTFAPFYPRTNSRYSFGTANGFILFQPELSFAQHDLPPDTPYTDWNEPKTVRDRIRIAFKEADQEYNIPETIYYPMAHDIVKPMKHGDSLIEWWNT